MISKRKKTESENPTPKEKPKKIIPRHMRDVEFNWSAPETNSKKKTNDWYFILWTIAVAGAVISFMLDNVLFGIFILISAFIISIYASQTPQLISFSVSRKGIMADTMLLPFHLLASFSISESQEPTYLLLQSKKTFSPLFSFPISEEIEIEDLREFLLAFIDEREIEVPTYQKLMDKIGF